MEKVTGRSDDMMIVRGVNVFPTQIEELLLRCEGLSAHYVIELTRDNRMDDMTVRVEANPAFADDANRAEQKNQLAGLIKKMVGVTAKVVVADPESMERSMGKAMRVIDKRGS